MIMGMMSYFGDGHESIIARIRGERRQFEAYKALAYIREGI